MLNGLISASSMASFRQAQWPHFGKLKSSLLMGKTERYEVYETQGLSSFKDAHVLSSLRFNHLYAVNFRIRSIVFDRLSTGRGGRSPEFCFSAKRIKVRHEVFVGWLVEVLEAHGSPNTLVISLNAV